LKQLKKLEARKKSLQNKIGLDGEGELEERKDNECTSAEGIMIIYDKLLLVT
jgi:hypothetical protein